MSTNPAMQTTEQEEQQTQISSSASKKRSTEKEQKTPKKTKTVSKETDSKKAEVGEVLPLDMLDDNGLLLRVDIRAYGPSGEIFKVAGVNTMPLALDDALAVEACRNFEQLFEVAVAGPLRAKFNALISEIVRKRKNAADTEKRYRLEVDTATPEFISDAE